jgi:alcohol dehydrogenase (cytochrome c)
LSPRSSSVAAAILLVVALVLAGCGGDEDQSPTEIGWVGWGNDPQNSHFAYLHDIDAENVKDLKVAWTRPGGQEQSAWETFPIVVGGTMYYDTGLDQVFAVDAATGKVRWTYTPPVNFLAGPGLELSEPVSRGVTYGNDKIFVTTADARLIALDAGTGKVLWKTQVADPEAGNTMNSPGTFWKGEILVGGPAGDAGLRGFVAAYSAATGKQLWRTHMVPPPGKGWNRARGTHGGGDVWMPPTVDGGTAYVATGNPTPGFTNADRPGCNPMADAVVALDAKTGAIKWSHTMFCDDSWDYDTVQAPLLLNVKVDGTETAAVGSGSKSGYYAVLDAKTGKPISRSPFITRFSRPHLRPTRKGTVVCPGIFGGIEYGPAALSPSPTRESIFVAGNQMCQRYKLASRQEVETRAPGEDDLGGTVEQVGPATGVLAAIDPASGKVRWKAKLPSVSNGGALATSGGLVFVGADDGYLRAFDQETGKLVWRYDLHRRVGSAPITYVVDDVQYLAIAAGGSLVEAKRTVPDAPARLFVFKLGD